MKEIFLKPGEIAFTEEPAEITTVLGSCVAVCIHDKRLKYGGMCHYYLPYEKEKNGLPNNYGEHAIPNLLREFKKIGSHLNDLSAKLLGGGYVMEKEAGSRTPDIGKENLSIANAILNKLKIPIQAKAVGGNKGKKVKFNTSTGEIRFKDIESTHSKTAAASKAEKIKVMIIDDSKPIRKIIRSMIELDPSFVVINEAEHPVMAEEMIKERRPDVITLDIRMPYMDGVTYLGKYMPRDPIPTIIITSINLDDSGPVFQAMELGAFDYIKKPALSEITSLSTELHEKLKSAFAARFKIKREVSVITKEIITAPDYALRGFVIAIGASTGGTEAIKDLLIRLPSNIPPVVVVQHIPPVFSKAFADRLNKLCSFDVREAEEGDELKCGRVLIAQGGRHMKIVDKGGTLTVKLTDDPPVNRFIPSVDYMFDSVSGIRSKKIIAALLTGMGEDGARGLFNLKEKGALTIAQDEKSSVVFGMPKAAIEKNAALRVASLFDIAGLMAKHINTN